MNVVADSSPLIVLSKIGYFDLLPKLYPIVFITPEVYAEVVVAGINQPGATQVAKAYWIEVKPLADSDRLSAAQIETGLGAGEISTILLAKEIKADLALIDDLPARKLATREGLDVRGSVGILERLFARNELLDLRDAFLKLLQVNAYVDRHLLNQRLKLFGLQAIS